MEWDLEDQYEQVDTFRRYIHDMAMKSKKVRT